MGFFSKTKKVIEPKAVDTTPPAISRSEKSVVSAGTNTRRVLIRPHASEKAVGLEPQGTYVFFVRDDANKTLVKEEVERRYGVKVARVNIVRNRGAFRRFRGRSHAGAVEKKALVTLAKGATIDLK